MPSIEPVSKPVSQPPASVESSAASASCSEKLAKSSQMFDALSDEPDKEKITPQESNIRYLEKVIPNVQKQLHHLSLARAYCESHPSRNENAPKPIAGRVSFMILIRDL